MKNPVFKQNNQGEVLLFPSRLDETISATHLVRVINQVVDKIDISDLLSGYKGGGTSSYHPRMLLKVLLYGYCLKIYTGRKIANALCSDITFMWLSGKQTPDFRTINSFRSGRLKESIEAIFKSLLLFMFEEGYIRMEEYYCDGTTLQADANKYKVTWKKNLETMRDKLTARIEDTIMEINTLNAQEDACYGDKDLCINGESDSQRAARIEEKVKELNRIAHPVKEKQQRLKQLETALEIDKVRVKVYEEKIDICGTRSGYSTTDTDASPMRTKECQDDLRPCYNGMIGSEEQYITGVSVHQNTNDATCFKHHMEEVLSVQPQRIKAVIADAIFGTEENYEYLQGKGIDDFLKFPSYDKEQTKSFKENGFLKDNMPYDTENDCFICPNGKKIAYRGDETEVNRNGFVSTYRLYECEDCSGCPFWQQCGTGQREEGGNRIIRVNKNLERHRQRTREKLKSEKGHQLYRKRGHDVETCFGDIKMNQRFRRVNLRGLKKVKTEFTVIAMAHNLRKMQINIEKMTA